MLWEVVHVYTTWNHKHIHVTTTFMIAPMYGCVHKLYKKVKNKKDLGMACHAPTLKK